MANNIHTFERCYPEEKCHYQDKKIPELGHNTDKCRQDNFSNMRNFQQFNSQCS